MLIFKVLHILLMFAAVTLLVGDPRRAMASDNQP